MNIRGDEAAADEARELMKLATQAKARQDWPEAVRVLHRAYAAMDRSGMGWGVEPFLRLPQFLHAAGKPAEALAEYERLLATRAQAEAAEIRPMMESQVYDKMRLLHTREAALIPAIRCAALAHVRWAYGLFLQKRSAELAESTAAGGEATIRPLLKKLKREAIVAKVCEAVSHECAGFPKRSDEQLLARIDELLAVAPK